MQQTCNINIEIKGKAYKLYRIPLNNFTVTREKKKKLRELILTGRIKLCKFEMTHDLYAIGDLMDKCCKIETKFQLCRYCDFRLEKIFSIFIGPQYIGNTFSFIMIIYTTLMAVLSFKFFFRFFKLFLLI